MKTPPAPILAIGTDLCAVARCVRELHPEPSATIVGILRPDELRRCLRHPHPARAVAACFAGKEAVIKALAPAGGQGTFWQDIEVTETDGVVLHGRLADLARAAGIRHVHLATAHCRAYATACAIASG